MPELPARGLVVAVVGAESTGKSSLCQCLAPRLQALTGLTCSWVPEVLRSWCDERQRTPLQHEQAEIAAQQGRNILSSAATHQLVLADTTPLMTAVYHWQVFADASMDREAQDWHARCCDLTLLTALDLPWVADGLQREGEHVREPVDARIRHLLMTGPLSFSVVCGRGVAREEAALDAISALLCRGPTRSTPAKGLFSRLARRDAAAPSWEWACDCDSPECEHASMRLRQGAR